MAKGKSSASSATRKKHARKALVGTGEEQPANVPKDKKQKKDKKGKEPRKKVYIPPVKPAPVQRDPLDTLGLVQTLPPELLVVLRRLSKKDAITKRRALEELQAGWVDRARSEIPDSEVLATLVETVPVWLHHLPALFIHPSRRIRLQAVGLHNSLLHLPSSVRDQILFFLREVASEDQAQFILGTWCLAANDVDRQVASLARESWNSFVSFSKTPGKLPLTGPTLNTLWELIQNTLLDPTGIYLYINPPQPSAPPPPSYKKGAKAPPPRKDDEVSRTKTEEEEESVQDRAARLRIGGFGAAEWVLNARATQEGGVPEDFLAPFANPVIWSALYPLKMSPFVEVENAGYNQPVVRRAAWALLQTLLRACKDHLQPLLATLSTAVLRAAWIETDQLVRGAMWQPLLTFLKTFPSAWELEAKSDKEDEDSDAESEDGEDEAQDSAEKRRPADAPNNGPSTAYKKFLQFLQLGCGGSPVQGYPAVLIILSTIPSSILGSTSLSCPLDDLFISLWAAVDARALTSLDRVAASAAFLAALLECTVFIARRILLSPPEQAAFLTTGKSDADRSQCRDVAEKLCGEQFKRVWEELSTGHLKAEGALAGSTIAQNLAALYHLDEELFRAAWESLTSAMRQQSMAAEATPLPLVAVLLKAFAQHFEGESLPGSLTKELVGDVVRSAVQQCDDLLNSSEAPSEKQIPSIVKILETFGDMFFADAELAQGIDDSVRRHTHRLLSTAPAILLIYLTRRAENDLCSSVWQDVLSDVVSHSGDVYQLLPPLLDAAEKGSLPHCLESHGQLDDLAGGLLAEALGKRPGSAETVLVSKLLAYPEHFISQSCAKGLAGSISSAVTLQFHQVLYDPSVTFDAFYVPLDFLRLLIEKRGLEGLPMDDAVLLFVDVLLFGYLVPQYQSLEPGLRSLTLSLWSTWLGNATDDLKEHSFMLIRQRLRELLADCTARPTSQQILQMVSDGCPNLDVDVLHDLFPSREALEELLDALPSAPADPSIAVLEPLVPPATQCDYDTFSADSVDTKGYSSYARICDALLSHLQDDRQVARENVWALRHLLALSIYADDHVKVPYAKSPVFSGTSTTVLQEFSTRVQQLTAYLLSVHAEHENWHKDVCSSVISTSASSLDTAGQLVKELFVHAQKDDTPRESRIMFIILQHILGDATRHDAEQWLNVAQKLEKHAPHMSLAILTAVNRYAPEPPLLDRIRNRLAADMLGVRPSKANTEGFWLLRRLTAVAPDPESDVVFLPQPRAVNLVKACQQWIASDEVLDEEVESEMTSVFFHLAPILQNIPGEHWDLIFDVLENNLENSSFAESETLVPLSRSLRLFIAIEDLASTNKALRATWEERRTNCLTMIRDIVAMKPDIKKSSTPLSACRELGLQVLQDLPSSLMDESTIGKFCHILSDSSLDVQRMGYHLLHDAAKRYTEHTVIEAAVDSEASVQAQLPAELLDLLQHRLNLEEPLESNIQGFSGHLLGWMLAFDLFPNASLKVKAGYTDQLKDLDLVASFFLPAVFNILGIYDGLARTFKLEPWAVDEFYLDLYSTESPLSLRLLAAHLYYRALLVVPSLVRNWLADCRDLQLLRAVTGYTSNNFSPAIIRAELSQVKDTDAAADLKDENLSIKVANAVSEVTAVYTVDEHQLEMTVKLPSDYPLHGIEIKDTKRFGVPEDRWRAWVLGVQQILSYRSGTIVDGLSFFKKNVTSHFEGLAECAICYSIISAMDATLPRKPCKTCKNRFHAGCLYKWFNSSHSSSCPLCRSEMV